MANSPAILSQFRRLHNTVGLDKMLSEYDLLLFAYFSYFCYCEYWYVSQALFGLTEDFHIIQHKSADILIIEFETFVVVSFRGILPRHIADFITILNFTSKTFYDIQAHKGFVKTVNLLEPYIDSRIYANDKQLFFTGHSMGAALSNLMAMKVKPDVVYMYGPPKFVTRNPETDKISKRIVNGDDFVTRLPPFTFRHIGEYIKIESKNNLFTSHKISNYIKSLHQFYKL